MMAFFRGRLASSFILVGAAAALITSSATAAGSVASAMQETYDGPPPPAITNDAQPATPSSADRDRYRCTSRATAAETIASCEGLKTGKDKTVWLILAAIAIGVVLYFLLRNTKFANSNMPLEQTLLEEGPQLPVDYPDGSLSVRGFARDGWPVVVDFEPQPGTVTQLELQIGEGREARRQTIVLDPDGSQGRRLVTVETPSTGIAPEPRPATYLVTSLPIAALDVERPESVAPASLKIYGIGGGPRAVGSVAIEQLAFSPSAPGATFSYFAKSEFSKARAQVQRLERSGRTIRILPVFISRESNLSVGRRNGSWPGTAAGSNMRSAGLHRLQVTGWFTTDDRSWVAALAPDLIQQ